MKAIVSITIDNEFVVHDIKVIEGEKGLFIAMPSRKAADGEYRDIAHPINSGTRDMIQSVILEKYATAALEEQAGRAGIRAAVSCIRITDRQRGKAKVKGHLTERKHLSGVLRCVHGRNMLLECLLLHAFECHDMKKLTNFGEV